MNKKYTKKMLGIGLKHELKKEYDIVRISRWAYGIFSENIREIDLELEIILTKLFRMESDEQFEYSEQELHELTDKLINENEE